MKSINNAKQVYSYLNSYLNQNISFNNCRDILLCNDIENLNKYSKKILSLAMKKFILEAIIEDDKDINKEDLFKLNINDLISYINLYIKKRNNISRRKNKDIKYLNKMYNNHIDIKLKNFTNMMFEIPLGKKTSISNLYVNFKQFINKGKYVLEHSNKKNFKRIIPITCFGLSIGFGAINSIRIKDEVTHFHIQPAKIKEADTLEIRPDIEAQKQMAYDRYHVKNTPTDDIDNKEIVEIEGLQAGITTNNTNYTFYYDKWNKTSLQRDIADEWAKKGMESDKGIATIDGKYLVAMTKIFGDVGDDVDVVLEDGTIIPCMIADEKGTDAENIYGHYLRLPSGKKGIDVVEWEATNGQENIELGNWNRQKVKYVIKNSDVI